MVLLDEQQWSIEVACYMEIVKGVVYLNTVSLKRTLTLVRCLWTAQFLQSQDST